MKALPKIHKDFILEMINNKDGVRHIKAYCKGAEIDTDKYTSPIHISKDNKLSMTYRGVTTYYYLNN